MNIKDYFVDTKTGPVRKVNQDAVFADVCEEAAFFVVADGMGGHSHGERASAGMIDGLTEWWKNIDKSNLPTAEELIESLVQCIKDTSKAVYDMFEARGEKGGSTVVAMFIMGNMYNIVTVGDSRAYCYDGKLHQLTQDDVWENLPGVKFKATNEQLRADKRYGKLTQATGYDEEIMPRVSRGFIDKGVTLLLCTDGIYKFCSVRELSDCLKNTIFVHTAAKKYEMIEEVVLRRGAKDNYSAIIINMK